MKKILLVTDAWAPQANGVVRVQDAHIAALKARGYRVEVIHPEQFRNVSLPTYPEIHLALFRPHRRIKKMIEEFQPDAIHSRNRRATRMGGAFGLYEKRNTVHDVVSQPLSDICRYTSTRALAPSWYTHAAISFQSGSHHGLDGKFKEELESTGFKKNIVVVPLGADIDIFVRNPSPPLPPLLKPVFVYFGRLAIEKNPEEFLQLELPGTKLVMGDGPLRLMLEKKYPEAHFFGRYKVGKEFVDQLSLCDVFVFPSRTETFGLVVLEALALGIPVAAHDVMGPRDIITPGKDGYLSEDLGEAALKCLETFKYGLSKKGGTV